MENMKKKHVPSVGYLWICPGLFIFEQFTLFWWRLALLVMFSKLLLLMFLSYSCTINETWKHNSKIKIYYLITGWCSYYTSPMIYPNLTGLFNTIVGTSGMAGDIFHD